MARGPDYAALFALASGQMGYFTAEQARESGFSTRLLQYSADTGRFTRIRRGLYRLRDYPSTPREEIMAAWLAAGQGAIVSHESALDLLGLSNVIPNAINLYVPRSSRHPPAISNVAFHTTTRPFAQDDIVVRDGMRVTSPTRTILDTAEAGAEPEQVALAIQQAVDRGMITRNRLTEAATLRSKRVSGLIHSALSTEK